VSRTRRGALVATAVLALAACGDAPPSATPGPGDPLSGDLTVLAAASLTDTFTELGDVFTAEHPGVRVSFSFGGSSGLAEQIASGAPADVFAAASPATMTTVVDAGAADGEPTTFATNTLQVVVPAGNPAGVTGLADLADPDLTVALCSAQVPCGAASEKVFAAAGLTPAPDTLEQDVRAVLTKVELGEVDAGLVYRTDVLAAGDAVEGVDVPEATDAVNDYPVAVLADAPNPAAARAFVDLVLSDEGRAVLRADGFGAP
jgi:molybdate transport system substrate-binding protein